MRAISLPFRFDGYGRVASTTDMTRVWADRVRTVVSTQPGERVMRPDYGCPMPESLFEAMVSVPELVESDVVVAFEKWLPALKFDRLDLNYEDEANGEIEVNLAYDIPTIQIDSTTRYSIII
jgi:phage baseplate assembly protein W